MPTVLPGLKGWRVVIYTNDHRPPHVHMVGPTVHARFELLCDLGSVRLMSTIGFRISELRRVEAYLLRHLEQLCNDWNQIHGLP